MSGTNLRRGLTAAWLVVACLSARASPAGTPPGEAVSFADLPGFVNDDHRAAFAAFVASCRRTATPAIVDRVVPPPAFARVCSSAISLSDRSGDRIDEARARTFFETRFTPYRVASDAFFTGYYEPVVEGSLVKTAAFATPLYPLPDRPPSPMPDRTAIETGALAGLAPLVYLHDPVEAFFVQVQGSARIVLPDGSLRRLVYAGRNGQPYTAIGKLLVQALHIPPEQMGMSQLKAWIRANGQGPGEAGTILMRRNRSYIFFRFDNALPSASGPIGGAGISLVPLRSLAIDRTIWPYGVPFFIDATMPWAGAPSPFQRIVVAQDTGAAIVGRARGDLFFGTGAEAAGLAGAIRQSGTLFVLWPRAEAGR